MEDTRKSLHLGAQDLERLFRTLFETSRDGVLIARPDGTIIRANPAACRMFGRSEDEVCRLGRAAIVVDDDRLRRFIAERDRAGIAHGEVLHRRADGSTYLAEVTAALVPTVSGEVYSYVIFRDVSEHRRLESEREESEKRFRNMADNIPQLAWMAEPDGNIFFYNRRWYEFTGTVPEQMRGWGWRHVHHPEHIGSVMRKWAAGIASRVAWEDTFPLRRHDGEYRWFLSRALPIKDERGNVLRWFGTNTDVTEQRDAAQRLAEADRRKSEFIGVLSHELRN